MIKVNERNILPQRWSLRDISKIFMRIKYQKSKPEIYINISTEINLIFYALSSIPKEEEEDKAEKISELIYEIFNQINQEINKDDIKTTFLEQPNLEAQTKNEDNFININYYIIKNDSKIQIGKLIMMIMIIKSMNHIN